MFCRKIHAFIIGQGLSHPIEGEKGRACFTHVRKLTTLFYGCALDDDVDVCCPNIKFP